MNTLTTIDLAAIGRLRQWGVMIAVVGAVLGAVGIILSPAQIMPSWLIGFLFCLGLSLGSLAILMLQHMSGGQWGLVSRRILEAGASLLPYCLLLFLPIAAMTPSLYPWARAGADADPVMRHQHPYMNLPLFLVRAAIYFGVWIFCATSLNGWSAAQDRGELALTEADTRRFRVVSAPGLLLYVVLMSLAAIDWIMSLDPHWFSTIFGFIMVAGQALCGLSFSAAILALLSRREPMNSILRTMHIHDIGKLMLAFVMLWAYFAFSQFLIIWAGNLPEEITFFLTRLHGGWQYVSLVIVFGHFVLPFCLLLSADLKRRPGLLARVAWFIIAVRLVDVIWLVAPNFGGGRLSILNLANLGIPLALSGLWLILFASRLASRPLVPINDPYFKHMLAHPHQGGH